METPLCSGKLGAVDNSSLEELEGLEGNKIPRKIQVRRIAKTLKTSWAPSFTADPRKFEGGL